tara:strand:- start:19821 stop:20819 length:999 start_codon:yes stop_codon:yes gene_type:complete
MNIRIYYHKQILKILNKNKTIYKQIIKSKENNWLNVFFVTSPIVAIITRMIIDYFKIDSKDILIVSFRNTDLSLLNYQYLYIKPGKYDRYFEKLLFISPSGKKILKKINEINNNFFIYASLAFREVNWVLNSSKSKGHAYIEEGQHSYMKIVPYQPSKITLYNRFKKNWKNRFSENDTIGYYFRDDAIGYIGMLPEVFPEVKQQKKIVLNNFASLKKYYKPKLMGVRTIGITCASRRVNKENLELMIEKLLSRLPEGSVIKPHPSFTVNKKIFNNFKKIFNQLSRGKVTLCTNKIILEIEMLYESKKLIGPKSSLSKYANYLGSSYEYVKLY